MQFEDKNHKLIPGKNYINLDKIKTSVLLKNNQPVPQCLAKSKKTPTDLPKQIYKSAQYTK